MKKIKKTISFVKENLQNKRTRAITLLSLYLIFFALLYLLMNINDSNEIPSQVDDKKEEEISSRYTNLSNNYSYKYNIEIQTKKEVNKYEIIGKYVNNETDYTITKLINNKYTVIDNFDLINEKMLYIENILNYIDGKEYEYQTKYKNGIVLENYKISIKDINSDYKNDDSIEINIESKDNFINKISFDSSKLDQFLNDNIIISKYNLYYENTKEKTIDNK